MRSAARYKRPSQVPSKNVHDFLSSALKVRLAAAGEPLLASCGPEHQGELALAYWGTAFASLASGSQWLGLHGSFDVPASACVPLVGRDGDS